MKQFSPEINKLLKECPLVFDWVEYKDETCFAGYNFEKSEACGRHIIDLYYCATTAMNGIVLRSVNWVPEHFNLNPAILNK